MPVVRETLPYRSLRSIFALFTFLISHSSVFLLFFLALLTLLFFSFTLRTSCFYPAKGVFHLTRSFLFSSTPKAFHLTPSCPLRLLLAHKAVQLTTLNALPQPEAAFPLLSSDKIQIFVLSTLQRSLLLPPPLYPLHLPQFLYRPLSSSLQHPL